MTTWVPYWDDSFQQATDLKAMYDAGYRVMAGYVAGGSSGKWSSAERIQAWKACGPDTGFFPLFEATGTEPQTDPASGADHAKAALAGARARGIPDSVSISPAMDRNVDPVTDIANLARYCTLWAGIATKPTMYVEPDAGGVLYARGLTLGTFAPAAYSWNNPPVLETPTNAPAHVVATQEHNGVSLGGGDVDTGHIRTDAACIWWLNSTGEDMALTQADADLVAQTLLTKTIGHSGPTVGVALQNGISDDAVAKLLAKVPALATLPTADELAAAIVAKLPQGTAALTAAQIQAAVMAGLDGIDIKLTAAQP